MHVCLTFSDGSVERVDVKTDAAEADARLRIHHAKTDADLQAILADLRGEKPAAKSVDTKKDTEKIEKKAAPAKKKLTKKASKKKQ